MKDAKDPPPRDKSFRELVGKVRPLVHNTIDPQRARTPPQRRPIEPEVLPSTLAPAATTLLGSDSHDAALATDYHRPGLQHSVLRKLRRGQYPVQDELDLHGLTLSEAGGVAADTFPVRVTVPLGAQGGSGSRVTARPGAATICCAQPTVTLMAAKLAVLNEPAVLMVPTGPSV